MLTVQTKTLESVETLLGKISLVQRENTEGDYLIEHLWITITFSLLH